MPSKRNDNQGSQDEREHARHLVHEKASICVLGRESKVQCDVLDLSLGGSRLRLLERLNLTIGMEVEGTFRIRGAPLRLLGTVCWTDCGDMIGIRFCSMSARCKQRLREAVDEIRTQKVAISEAILEHHLGRIKY